jgi:hypothetical protein
VKFYIYSGLMHRNFILYNIRLGKKKNISNLLTWEKLYKILQVYHNMLKLSTLKSYILSPELPAKNC